jgi:hypothetical protein
MELVEAMKKRNKLIDVEERLVKGNLIMYRLIALTLVIIVTTASGILLDYLIRRFLVV